MRIFKLILHATSSQWRDFKTGVIEMPAGFEYSGSRALNSIFLYFVEAGFGHLLYVSSGSEG